MKKHKKSIEEMLEAVQNNEEPLEKRLEAVQDNQDSELEKLRKENEELKEKLYKANEKVSEYTNKEFKEELEKTKQKIAEYESRIKTIEEQIKEKETKDFYEIGKKLYEEGKYEEAKELFEKCGELNPRTDADDLCYIGECLLQMGKNKEALVKFEETIKINKNNTYAWYRKGDIIREHDVLSAINIWKESPYPKDPFIINFIDNFEDLHHNPLTEEEKKGLEELRYMIKKKVKENADEIYKTANQLYHKGKEYWKEAMDLYKQVIRLDPENNDAIYCLGDLQWEYEGKLKAFETWKRASKSKYLRDFIDQVDRKEIIIEFDSEEEKLGYGELIKEINNGNQKGN